MQPAFCDRTVPFLKEAEYSAGGIKAHQGVIAAKQQRGQMSTIGIAQAPCLAVKFCKEEAGIRVVRRILIEKLIHGAQKALRLIQGNGTLAPQVCLQVGHQKSAGNSLSGNITQHQAKPLTAEIEEVVIVTANLACLQAKTRVIK